MDSISNRSSKREVTSLVRPIMELFQDPRKQTDGAIRQTIAKRLGPRLLNGKVSTTFSVEPFRSCQPGFLERRVGMEDALKPQNRVLQEPRWLGQEDTVEVGRFDVLPAVPSIHELCEEVTCDMLASTRRHLDRRTPVSSLGDWIMQG